MLNVYIQFYVLVSFLYISSYIYYFDVAYSDIMYLAGPMFWIFYLALFIVQICLAIKVKKIWLITPMLLILFIIFVQLPPSWQGSLSRSVGYEQGVELIDRIKHFIFYGLLVVGFALGVWSIKIFERNSTHP